MDNRTSLQMNKMGMSGMIMCMCRMFVCLKSVG